MGNLNDEKSLDKIARTIFAFEVGESCSITGFAPDPDEVDGVSPRGKQVIKLLKELYQSNFIRKEKGKTVVIGKKLRARINYSNTIGGSLALPIWRYKETISNNQVKYNIWRIQ